VEAYDVIVVGVGGMGSATVAHLARRGVRVLGLEQYDIPHERGSSHGLSRIIRLAYFEHPAYVPLLHRAYELWWALEREVQEQLLIITGSLDIGSADSTVFGGALKAAQLHHLVHEVLGARGASPTLSGYGLQAPLLGLYQPQGGLLAAERCLVAHVNTALRHGAHIHGREALQGWEIRGDSLVVRTSRGTYQAQRLVLTAGAWTHRLVTQYTGTLQPERQVMIWMQPRVPAHFQIGAFPVFNMAVEEGTFYGFPSIVSPASSVRAGIIWSRPSMIQHIWIVTATPKTRPSYGLLYVAIFPRGMDRRCPCARASLLIPPIPILSLTPIRIIPMSSSPADSLAMASNFAVWWEKSSPTSPGWQHPP
jgi:monomeric sarcosine oxidase